MPTTVRPVLSNKCLSLKNDQPICKHLASTLQSLTMLAIQFQQEGKANGDLLERIRDKVTNLLPRKANSGEQIADSLCIEALANLATMLGATSLSYFRLPFDCKAYQPATTEAEAGMYTTMCKLLDGEMGRGIFELRESNVADEINLRKNYLLRNNSERQFVQTQP